jgi:ribosomal protein L6P/L9E
MLSSLVFHKEFSFLKRISIKVGTLNSLRFFIIIKGPFGSLCYFIGFIPKKKDNTFFLPNKSILTSFYTLFNQSIIGITSLHKFFLQMVGVGYKSYIPKTRNYKYLVLKVGFGSVDLGYNLDLSLKGRSRKQKFILVGTDLCKLAHNVRTIINLKYPNSYTGKGIRLRNQTILLKKNKQQQRSK